jgi:hypothetical protein
MGPRQRPRHEIIELLGRAAEEAKRAEMYHQAARDPAALKGRERDQAACDAAAMQLIELAGCAEDFTRDRGESGTTLARFDDALRPLFEMRNPHTHPEVGCAAPPMRPQWLRGMLRELKTAIGNLDSETLRLEARDELEALSAIGIGLARIERDGLPNPAALRPRDLHYAGYYREIQFGRVAKATGLYDNFGKSRDPRHNDLNSAISDADDLAHRFHDMRRGSDKSVLPVSIVSPRQRDRVADRLLSEVTSELRDEYAKPGELAALSAAREAAVDRDAARGLAQQYARMTGDSHAAASIHGYLQRQQPPLDREMIGAMRKALHAAAGDPAGGYLGAPEAVRNQCLDLSFELDRKGDGRLLDILDAAEARSQANVDKPEGITVRPAAPNRNKEPHHSPPVFSRWTGEPLGEAADMAQSAGKGQSHR